VTLVLVAQFISGLEEKAATLKVRLAGQENAPALVNFLQRNDVEIEAAPVDYPGKIREGRLDAVIVVPKDFDERYLAGDGARVDIVYDDSRAESGPAIRQAERLLRAFNRESGDAAHDGARREPRPHRAGEGAAREHGHAAAEGRLPALPHPDVRDPVAAAGRDDHRRSTPPRASASAARSSRCSPTRRGLARGGGQVARGVVVRVRRGRPHAHGLRDRRGLYAGKRLARCSPSACPSSPSSS
jgi:hypothetical protein